MARNAHANLFSPEDQPDMFGAAPAPAYRPDPDKVRRRLHKMLAEARAAETMPWRPAIVTLYQTIFPQMTGWLPPEEAEQLRFEFDKEMQRLADAA